VAPLLEQLISTTQLEGATMNDNAVQSEASGKALFTAVSRFEDHISTYPDVAETVRFIAASLNDLDVGMNQQILERAVSTLFLTSEAIDARYEKVRKDYAVIHKLAVGLKQSAT
jgi:hypothetical protein